MKTLFSCLALCGISAVLIHLVSAGNKTMGILLRIAAGCVILFQLLPLFTDTVASLKTILPASPWIGGVGKICGVAVLGQWGSQMSRDAGENAMADKMELCTKLCILSLCLPYIGEIFSMASQVL